MSVEAPYLVTEAHLKRGREGWWIRANVEVTVEGGASISKQGLRVKKEAKKARLSKHPTSVSNHPASLSKLLSKGQLRYRRPEEQKKKA